MLNPFPGAQPYSADERERFFGRESISGELLEAIFGSRCITVFGPMGVGKTSLMRAAVLPALQESHDARIVFVSEWPVNEEPARTLAQAMERGFRLKPRETDNTLGEIVVDHAKRAARASSRLMVLCLDQIETLFFVDREPQPTNALFDSIEGLLGAALGGMRIVFLLREDYLGRVLDRLRGRVRILEQYLRIPPLTVGAMTELACRIAAMGEPPQTWNPDDILPEIMQLRGHDQAATAKAEVRLSYAQRYCRALFGKRATQKVPDSVIREQLGDYVERTSLMISDDMLDEKTLERISKLPRAPHSQDWASSDAKPEPEK